MKNYKIFLISFVLLIFMIGAVSAVEDNSDDAVGDQVIPFVPINPIDVDPIDVGPVIPIDVNPIPGTPVNDGSCQSVDSNNNTQDIYVNDTGDDSNTGSAGSPYATINKAVSDVNSSAAATIHLSEGIFASDNDSSLNINLNHEVDGGSLTIVGAGPDKTFVDGQAAFRFASIVGSNVILKDISFIYFNQWNGAAITLTRGSLTIDNCIFKEIYAKSFQGAITAGGNTAVLTVKNSKFINCSINGQSSWSSGGGAAIFAQNIASLTLINNTFISNTIASGKGVAIYSNSKSYIDGNKFIYMTGTTDASIYLNAQGSTLCNNEFINCSNPSTTSSIVNIDWAGSVTLKNNTFTNSSNALGNIYALGSISGLNFTMPDNVINVGNDEVNKGTDVEVVSTDDMGNIVTTTGFTINFVNDKNTYNLKPSIVNGKFHINFNSVPEVGIYNVTITSGGIDSDVLTTADVHCSSEPVDLYISPEGDDANNGTFDSPFATIQHALDVGFGKTFNVRVHLLEGTYSGEGNVGLRISNKGSLQLIGEKYNETIIDGEGENSFISASTELLVKNLTFTNGSGVMLIQGGKKASLENCIIDKNYADYNIIFNVNMNNVVYTNNIGSSELNGNDFVVNNSYFANNHNYDGPCVLDIVTQFDGGSNSIENCKFINNSASEYGGALAGSGWICKNNYFEGNTAPNGGAIYVSSWISMTLDNCTFVNNKADTNGVFAFSLEDYSDAFETPALKFNDCKFINNSAIKAGVGTFKIAIFNDCLFENNTADYGGALVLLPYCFEPDEPAYIDEENEEIISTLELNNAVFKNNVAKVNGNDIYLEEKTGGYWDEDSAYFYAIPLTITFKDSNVSSLKDDLTAVISGPDNISVGSASGFTFLLGGNKIGTTNIVNGVATITYDAFEDGEYDLSGNSYLPSSDNIVNSATVKVKLENVSDDIEFWISPEGSDDTGKGSESNPFNSISYAINEAMKKSRNIIIHLTEGNYIGDLNTNLTLPSSFNITLIGAGMDKTIIDGENASYFAKITEGKYPINVAEMTITNMIPENVAEVINRPAGSAYSMVSNLLSFIDNGISPITVLEGGALNLNNVNISKNRGGKAIIENYGNLVVNNSIFDRNGFVAIGLIIGHYTIIDNTLLTSNFAVDNLLSSDLLIINNSELKNNFNLYGYSLTNGGRSYLNAVDVSAIIENTKISNDGDNSSLKLIGYDGISTKLAPAFSLNRDVNATNISMINEFKSPCPEFTTNYYRDGARLAPIGWIWGSGDKFVNVYNSTFKNFQYIWSHTTSWHSEYNFDGCVFDNITKIAVCGAYNAYQGFPETTYNVSNSVFINTGMEIDRTTTFNTEVPLLTLDNNYWGSNDKPVITFLNQEGTFEPDTWIVLYSEDEQTVIKNLTDGENVTAYTGNAPIRTDYADNNGALDYAVVFGPVGYLFTTDDDKNVIFNPEDAMYPFEAADPMDYRTPSVITITGLSGDLGIVGVLVDIVGNPIANATISSIVGGENITNVTTDENGVFTVKGIKNGVLTLLFNGTVDYFDTEYNLTFENAGKTTKSFINLDTIESDLAVKGTLVDDEGNPIANAVITYTLNGENATNVTTDVNGAFQVQAASDAVLDIVFAGSEGADPVNSTLTIKGLATLRSATVINSSDFTQYSCDFYEGERGGNFTFQLTDEMGNPLSNKTVYIGYNGVTLNRTTDENGFANVQINLKNAGLYTFVVVFLGDEDNNASMAVHKVTIEKKTTSISASAKSFKATVKTKKYTVTLKTIKGSSIDGKTYLAAGKKLTLTVNGKTFKAKTNAKGQATFKITGLNKKGKFTAKVAFDGDSTYNAANKSVKLTIK